MKFFIMLVLPYCTLGKPYSVQLSVGQCTQTAGQLHLRVHCPYLNTLLVFNTKLNFETINT